MTSTDEQLRQRYPLAFEGHVHSARYAFFGDRTRIYEDLTIIFAGHEQCAPDYRIERASYPYFVVEIPLGGACMLGVNGNDHRLAAGTIGGFAPGVAHRYDETDDDPLEHIFIAFTGSRAPGLMAAAGLEAGSVAPMRSAEETVQLAHALIDRAQGHSRYAHETATAYLSLILLLQADGTVADTGTDAEGGDVASGSAVTARRCREYIDAHTAQPLSPATVAHACSVDVRYLAQLFRKHLNTTPREYITAAKMSRAAALLLSSNLSVGEVAASTGFTDAYHFSRNFKRYHGVAPREFRRVHAPQQGVH